MSDLLINAPSDIQTLAPTLFPGLTFAQIQPLWVMFLQQEGLTNDPTAAQDTAALKAAFAAFAAQSFATAPSNFLTALEAALPAGSSDAIFQAAWSQFLQQEGLGSNPLATDTATFSDFQNYLKTNLQSVLANLFINAPSNFQSVLTTAYPNLTSTQLQGLWSDFLQFEQPPLVSNPVASDTTALANFQKFVQQSLLLNAPPIFQSLMNGFLGNLSVGDQQNVWQQFLQSEGLTTNPSISDSNYQQVLGDFGNYIQQTFVGNVNLGAPNALSPNELTKRNVIFSAFDLLIQMLNTLQNTVAVQSNNLIYLGNLQQEYTTMMAATPTYLANPGNRNSFGSQEWFYSQTASQLNFGYGNITLQTLANQFANTTPGSANSVFNISSDTGPSGTETRISDINIVQNPSNVTAVTSDLTNLVLTNFNNPGSTPSQPNDDQSNIIGILGYNIANGVLTSANLKTIQTSTSASAITTAINASLEQLTTGGQTLDSGENAAISNLATNLATVNASSTNSASTFNAGAGNKTNNLYVSFVDPATGTSNYTSGAIATQGGATISGPRIELHYVVTQGGTTTDTLVAAQAVTPASDPTTLETNWENAFYSLINPYTTGGTGNNVTLRLDYNDGSANSPPTGIQFFPSQTSAPNNVFFGSPLIPYRYVDPPSSDSSTTDLSNATQNRGEINSELQQFIENARSARQDVQNQATNMQTNVSASKEAITEATDILNNFITGLQTMLAAIAQ